MDIKGSSDTLPSGAVSLGSPALAARYDLVSVIGRGGMGEVHLARDRRIGREVAVKLMRSDASDEAAMTRFFREAHVQGLLEHPSVVPIHDLGVDANGNPFFVMKRVTGTTLADVLAREATAPDAWSRAQLLARFVDVCHAIELAHSRGVIHRDLKPANIMLGEFGETYVLDWGLARVAASRQSADSFEGPTVGELATLVGDLLGTPGYMSPEQARGETVDPATDVYALGCVLFELLTGEPALPRGLAAIPETLAAEHHRPSKRGDVAPELDELCVHATDRDPRKRPSAHELATRLQAHVEGDRDLERREQLAAEHAKRARDAEAAPTDQDRALATYEAGRALALDPSNATAQRILGRLLLETPKQIPAEAIAMADEDRGRTRKGVLRTAGFGYLWLIGLLAILLLLPVRHPELLAATAVVALATGLVALVMSRWVMPMRSPWFIGLLLLNCALIGMSGLLFSPILVMPVFLIASLTGWLQQPVGYPPWIVVVAHAVPLLALLALEWFGPLPSTFHIESSRLIVTPWVFDLTPAATAVIFVASFIAQGATSAVVMLQNRYSQERAQNRLHAHAWHLRQLLPRADAIR